MTDQPTAAIVSRDDAIAFLENACRNWHNVPRLSPADIDDVRMALQCHRAENEAATIERCAAVAANHYPLNSAMRPCGTNIATAIRNLKGQTS